MSTSINPPVCDIITINYNAGAYLTRCVKSVYASDVNVNLIIVDNDSDDDSIAQINTIDAGGHALEIVLNSDNKGFATAVNIGAANATSDYIMLLNPDCEIHPHTVRKLIDEASQIDDLGVMGALVFNEDGTEQRGCRRLEPTFVRSMVTALRLGKYFQSVNLQFEDLPGAPISLDAVSGAAMLIKRETFDAINGMDEDYFLHVEDLDFCRRVREAGKKVYFTPNVSIFHHHGASSHAVPVHTEWHKHQGMLRYHAKFQQAHQNWLRSTLTRGVIYLNFALSVFRKWLSKNNQLTEPFIQSLVNSKPWPLIITGASSDLGLAILEKNQHQRVVAVSRQSNNLPQIGQEVWLHWSFFEKVPQDDFRGAEKWLAVSPIWSAPAMAKTLLRFSKLMRIVAVSSTSVVAKAGSTNFKEQAVVKALQKGEQSLLTFGEQADLDITIARASMVYGGRNNQNIAFIKKLIKLFRFFPMISTGNGLRQPVHVDDLTQGLLAALTHNKLKQQIYTLAGGEQLSYREMIKRIFSSIGKTANLKVVPHVILLRLADMMSYIPGLTFINREMITRMEDDMVYDIKPAQQDLQYSPMKFRP